GDPAAVPLLVRLLDDDPSPAVRADAAFALGELGDTSRVVLASLREAVPAGWIPVRDAPTPVVVEVVGALGKLGTPEARTMVADALREAHPGRAGPARRIAAQALLTVWRFEAGPGRVTAAARYLTVPDAELRWRATYALMRLAEPDGVRYLLPLLDDPDHRTRAYAARGLAAPAVDSAGRRSDAIEALESLLADEHPHVRINALRALAGYGDDAPLDAMGAGLDDDDLNVAVAAAGALAGLGPRAAPALRRGLGARTPGPVRRAVTLRLAALEPDSVLPVVRQMADGDVRQRRTAARSLAELGTPRAGELLERLAGDDDPRVAAAALAAAGSLAADSVADPADRSTLRTLLLRHVRSPAPALRAAALGAVRPLLRPEDLPTLLEIYGQVAADTTARAVALAAIDALAGLQERGTDASSAFFTRFPRPPGPAIHRWAAETLGDGWGPPPPPGLDRLADYIDIVRTYVAGPLGHGHRPHARIRTDRGEIVLELISEEAPLTVHNFVTLASAGFYDDGVWHRVVPNFVLQDGAPAGDPEGGPGWAIRDEINRVRYLRGTLGMALAGPDTGGSQWFITHSPQPHLDGGYTVFGRITDGLDVADAVVEGDLIQSIRIDG
ncbi:MAG: hypothetical protein GWM90_07195, partial [Gemmatimonadetes bacterium]|nr:hypothetical protein [Gemmatimonadota bacterium]NIQ53611.1 hypothetical protein [Gemmatimonadota bacterium]NIU73773.1 hypothetical protein [Gammaproteobacteria bacterium]NIX43900.1 hypothetical protein [Gemmatimonadota bacterium]NIY08118.1 hypothetical protein [Gemmatimonadota bacterium]